MHRSFLTPFLYVLAAGAAASAVACAGPDVSGDSTDLTSADGVAHTIDLDSFVDVAAGAPDDDVRAAIHLQLKSALGALREQGIGVADRDAQHSIAGTAIVRTTFDVVDASGVVVRRVDRVRFHYHDTALVEKPRTPIATTDVTMLYGDFVARAAELKPLCSDDQTTDADSLWYHFSPRRSTCRAAIRAEQRAIDDATAKLADPSHQVAQADADRRFITVRASLVPTAAAPTLYPEYDRLWGFAGDTSRTKVVVYAFFGVDANEADAHDNGLVELLRFQRLLRKKFPGLRVVDTQPNDMLLDFWIDGQKLGAVDWSDVENWVVDGSGWPAAAQTDAQKQQLLAQVIGHFSERTIVWQLPVRVTRGAATRDMTVELRLFYGWEDGSPDARLHARWRYLEAFWNADVFAYTGHSHFGHGPLEPWTYSGANFPSRYQVMLVNSCLSFNYYDEDFLAMHPNGSQDLDVVVNGLPAYWSGMGGATAGYVIGLLDGTDKSWTDVLVSMRVDLPWQSGYDPMRAVNGELDNRFTPGDGAIAVTALR